MKVSVGLQYKCFPYSVLSNKSIFQDEVLRNSSASFSHSHQLGHRAYASTMARTIHLSGCD